MYYSPTQWVLLFFIYCFLGWIWETGYVSVKSHRFENRGFLHGPLLPIYGSGAIIILFATLGVRNQLPLIYILGMLSATILEYCTGAAMQKMFGVRYWDYTKHHFNLNGYICLSVSLAWGVFSIFLVRILHPPVEELLLTIPSGMTETITMILAAVFSVDMTISVNEALDLKAMLKKKAESNEELRHLQNRIDFVYALAEEDFQRYKEEREEKAAQVRNHFQENLMQARKRYIERLDAIENYAKEYFQADQEKFAAFSEKLEMQRTRLSQRTDQEYRRLERILRRNPGTVSSHFKDELAQIRGLMKK